MGTSSTTGQKARSSRARRARRKPSLIELLTRRSSRVLVGDCLEWLSKLEAESVDLVVTSPPYNIGLAYNTYSDRRRDDDYLRWLLEVFVEVRRVLKPQGSFFLNIGATNQNPWLAFDVAMKARDLFVLQNHVVWAKSISIGDESHGHFKPINSTRYLNNTYEDLFHFTKTGDTCIDRKAVGVPFKYKSNIQRFGHAEDKRCKGNIWYVPYETVQSKADKGDHPAIYPVNLVEQCILLHGAVAGDVILDPFLGTGTTLVAGARHGLRGIGIELDGTYAELAHRRVMAEEERLDGSAAAEESDLHEPVEAADVP
jgi:site-specific DNA-methyltransferase (adenine-specific)